MKRLRSYLDDNEWKAKKVKIIYEPKVQNYAYISYKTKSVKACINIQSAKPYIFNHNARQEQPEYEAKYVVKELEKFNEYSCNASEANAKFNELYDEALANYFNRTHQKIQTKNLRFSAVVTINENHSLQDVQNLAFKIEQIYGFQPIQIAIHRDEGHFITDESGQKVKDENGNFIFDANLHAHIEFFALDKQGINRYKSKDRYRINKELQTLVANELGMQRGKDYAALGQKPPKHLTRQEYAKYKAMSERQALKEQSWVKENERLKVDLASLKEINETNKQIREQLKQSGANRADYAKLEQEISDYRQKIKNKELITKNEIEKFKTDYLTKLDEKMAKIAELEAQNQTLKSQNLELNELLNAQEAQYKVEIIENLSQEQKDRLLLETIKDDEDYYILTKEQKDMFLKIVERCKNKYIDKLNFKEDEKENIKFSLDMISESGIYKNYNDENEFLLYKNYGFMKNIKQVVELISEKITLENLNDQVQELIHKKNMFAKNYLELKKAWYGDKDSDEKELTPTQLKDFIKLYYTQSKERQIIHAIKKETSETAINKTLKNKKEVER